MIKRIAIFTLLLLAFTCAQAVAQKLKIAVSPSWPPLEYYDDQRRLSGFSVDYAHALARIIDMEYEIINIARSEVFAKLQTGVIDIIISSMSITPERSKMAAFSKSYLIAYQTLVTRHGNKQLRIDGSLAGKRIGAKTATTGYAIARNQRAQVINYTHIVDAFNALAAGHLDGVICDSPVARYFTNRSPAFKGKFIISDYVKHPEYYAIAMRHSQPDLMEKINKGIKDLEKNGTFDALVGKWIGH